MKYIRHLFYVTVLPLLFGSTVSASELTESSVTQTVETTATSQPSFDTGQTNDNQALSPKTEKETPPTNHETVSVNEKATITGQPEPTKATSPVDKTPQITDYVVTGELDTSKTGVSVYDNIVISLVGDNLTSQHFLTKEGLHWSDKTTVELIKGKQLGVLNDASAFGVQNTPTIPVTAYSNDIGDSGRITFVGKTQSNEDLDLIWTVTHSDKDEWQKYAKHSQHSRIKGLGFIGEQFIPNATGNAIAVLYNNASNLGLRYQIVKHNTFEEMPVVLSFISTDIDAAQGVQTNLANIVEIIPKESQLKKDQDIIYDTTKGVVGLNGSADLPKGGYLGAGFLSHFDYIFYSPAPQRVLDSYPYPIAVRYDIFGSSLQAKLLIRLKSHVTVSYVDESGAVIKPQEHFNGFQDEKYLFNAVKIPHYKIVSIRKDESDVNYPHVQFVYRPVYTVTLRFIDDKGRKVKESEQYIVEKDYPFTYQPQYIGNYQLPESFRQRINQSLEHTFVYKPIIKRTHQTDRKRQQSYPTPKIYSPVLSNQPIPVYNTIGKVTQPIVIDTTVIKKNVQQVIDVFKKIGREYDPFLENTGMTQSEKNLFLAYINNVEQSARNTYGNDLNKVNHAVANAIAYSAYHDDKLQKSVNDFGERPFVLGTSEYNLMIDVHKEPRFIVDFPHLAAPLATSESSGWVKDTLKNIIGFNLHGVPAHDVFFQLNSMSGDILTTIDTKDKISNQDAYILKYHPNFKDISLAERINRYYHIPNLNVLRSKLYADVLRLKAEEQKVAINDYIPALMSASFISAGGLFLAMRQRRKKDEEAREKRKIQANEKMKTVLYRPATKKSGKWYAAKDKICSKSSETCRDTDDGQKSSATYSDKGKHVFSRN